MRHIEKREVPEYFTDEVKELEKELNGDIKIRDVFDSLQCKQQLHKHMLKNEQNGLCGYCESKIENINNSHIEHIEAINENRDREKAKQLVFEYSNLIVSCDGVCHTKDKRATCGHKKDTKGFKPDYLLFLSPTKVENIRDHFIYTSNFLIGASSLDRDRSKETLRVLNLNTPDNFLPEARKKALKEFNESVIKRLKASKQSKEKIIKFLLSRENLAFISFLRFKYKDYI